MRYYTLLSSLFATTKSEIDRIIAEMPTMTYNELAHWWRTYLRAECARDMDGKVITNRDEFYERVARDMKVSLPYFHEIGSKCDEYHQ